MMQPTSGCGYLPRSEIDQDLVLSAGCKCQLVLLVLLLSDESWSIGGKNVRPGVWIGAVELFCVKIPS